MKSLIYKFITYKKIALSLFVIMIAINSYSQNLLSPAERKLLIEELKREILDSLRSS
jgi:hypothetical protein